ncbi:2-amino-4-hydroxy-6-hydroxymethyldihydropteridine pyrophosphokinase [wastewater metagenome]|uniref:2-amino-4-hydroxy-6-hydroxymethyldihydropteridine diphosphokinase n=2 Tax=unclassified sequences TaxID=12908 RepID=A0A5B8RAP9_9ZZZZ|nr:MULTISPECIES: 2-amino-4-hydroxy-6-hydroxymethyldihydropteridine diphosphokinase [Arhodomonas]MCS4505276.1 2-amino-4-hydroxy-6-hydroxymethyldihydropteridine diphosphokinase [Arhodomonas aquaeolei]QEA05018.1 2-amino-4-hydroxy-6-hydroxymethyldihydropteridine pyrophosphokinase [uncultured organism]
MTRVYVSIGSNIDRERNVRSALAALRARYGELEISPVYETEAVGFDGDSFLNLVVGFDADSDPATLTDELKAVEHEHGRERRAQGRYNSRTLDLDLLTWGEEAYEDGRIHLPRAEIQRYAFVLRPLADIAGERRHPTLGRRYADLWADFDASDQAMRRIHLE